jgi:hypothetical protein
MRDELDRTAMQRMLSKQVRSEYFNAQMSMISALERMSTVLAKMAPGTRNPELRRYIATLDETHARGLYFPTITIRDPHYAILRIPPQDCFSLNSRDKVRHFDRCNYMILQVITHCLYWYVSFGLGYGIGTILDVYRDCSDRWVMLITRVI